MILIVTGRTGVVAAGTVDQDVTGTEVGQDLLMDSLQSFQLQNIGLVTLHNEALCGDLFRQLQNSRLVQVQSCDLCTGLGIGTGHIAAQDTACTGNDHNLTGKIMGQRKIKHSK